MHSRCLDSDGIVFEDEYLISPKLAHLVDDIFWTLGFKSAEQCDKVHKCLPVFHAFSLLTIKLWQARGAMPLGAWEQRRAKIALTIDALPDFKSEICTGWSRYIESTYGSQTADQSTDPVQDMDTLVVEDD